MCKCVCHVIADCVCICKGIRVHVRVTLAVQVWDLQHLYIWLSFPAYTHQKLRTINTNVSLEAPPLLGVATQQIQRRDPSAVLLLASITWSPIGQPEHLASEGDKGVREKIGGKGGEAAKNLARHPFIAAAWANWGWGGWKAIIEIVDSRCELWTWRPPDWSRHRVARGSRVSFEPAVWCAVNFNWFLFFTH